MARGAGRLERGTTRDRVNAPRALALDLATRRLSLSTGATPRPAPSEALLATLLAGEAGEPPRDAARWVLGHECLAEVVQAPEGSGLAQGDRVVPVVRHGCGGCEACSLGTPDYCPTDDYTEHGIKGLDGFMRDAFADDAASLVSAPASLGDLAVLAEPMSVAIKALDTARHIARRVPWFEREGGFAGRRALVAGTGSLGSLAALLLRDEGMEVWGLDRSGDETAAARLLADVGAEHVNARERSIRDVAEEVDGFDLVIEATGAPRVVFDALHTLAGNGVMVMLGVPSDRPPLDVDGDAIMRRMVLRNQVLVGSVNSHRGQYEEALARLEDIRPRWNGALERVVTHTFAPEDFEAAFADAGPDAIKKVIDWRR